MVRNSPLCLAISFRRRRLLSLASLVCYVGVAGGFPLSYPSVIKSTSERFPCEKHACGCTSAAQCWHDCCCMTLAERGAWAEANGIAIPIEVRSELLASRMSPSRSCCAHRNSPYAQSKSCPSDRSTMLALPQFVRHCRGLATSWISCGAVTAPPARMACGLDLPLAECLVQSDPSLTSFSEGPDVPPPRA
jgi:hypothetical protein